MALVSILFEANVDPDIRRSGQLFQGLKLAQAQQGWMRGIGFRGLLAVAERRELGLVSYPAC
jgi:hypothetical protein